MRSKEIKISYKVRVIPSDGHFFCDHSCPYFKMTPETDRSMAYYNCKLYGDSLNSFGGKKARLNFACSDCRKMIERVAKIKPPIRKKYKWAYTPHKSHKMDTEGTVVRSPAGTARYYVGRRCRKCGAEQYEHAAGKFCDPELLKPCLHEDDVEDCD